MPNTLLHKRGTSKPSPSDLLVGEIAINTAEGKLFTENDSGYIWEAGELLGTFSSTTITYTVTVASKTSAHRYNGQGSSLGYKINGVFSPFLTFTPGNTYRFDQSDSSNSNHPLKFYLEADKSTLYSTDVTINGTAGQSGAYTEITISDTTPLVLHYQCGFHGYMGNAVFCNSKAVNYNDLQNKPSLFSGNYNDLSNKPSLFSGNYNDLSNKPSLFSGDYDDLSNKPSLFSGSYNDLSNKPTIPTLTSQLTNDAGFVTVSGGLTDGDKGDIVVASSGDSLLVDDGVIDNANIASNAAIAGSKINPDFGSQNITTTQIASVGELQVTSTAPKITFFDSDTNPDFEIRNLNGVLHFKDVSSQNVRMQINTDGHVDVTGNLDVGAGIDVTGASTFSGGITSTGSLILNQGVPEIQFNANSHENDFRIINYQGVFIVQDVDALNNRFTIASNGNTNFTGNVNCGAGLDVTGNITATGTIDGVLKNGVTATTQSAGDNSTKVATTAYTDTAIANLVNSAPSTLDTLGEIATALNNDAALNTTLTNSIATKLPLAGGTLTGLLTVTRSSNSGSDPILKVLHSNLSQGIGLGYHAISAIGANTNVDLKLQSKGSGEIILLDNVNAEAGIDVTGNITVTGTVDGRDLAADGSKLDGIAAGATNVTNNNQISNGAGYITSAALSGVSDGGNAASLDGIDSSQFLRSDQNDSSTGTITFSDAKGIRLSHSNQVNTDDGRIAAGAHGSGLNIVGTRTLSSGNRQVRIWGDVITDSGFKFWNASNDGAGSGLDSDLLDGQQGSHYLDYNNFSNTPTIPTNNNQLTNGAGHITSAALAGASDGGNAALLDGIDSTQFLRADQDDTTTGKLTFNTSANEKLALQGSNSPHIRFREGTTDKAFIQWNSSGFVAIRNQEDNAEIRLKDDFTFSPDAGANNYKIWHAANDGSGSGLDADTLDGVQASGLVAVGGDTMTGALRVDISSTVDGILGEAYSGYFGLKHTDQTINSEYMILSQDNHTYISASSGSNVYIRGGGNSSANQVIVSSSGTSIGGNTVFHAGNDGSGSGLDADLLDGVQASSFVRSDAEDSLSVPLNINGGTANGANDATLYITATNNNDWGLRVDKYNGSATEYGVLIDVASASAYALRIRGNDSEVFRVSGNGTVTAGGSNTVWHAGNDGSGSGLDADKLDGVQASSFVRNDNGAQTIAGNLTVGTGTASYIYMVDSDNGTRAIHNNSNFIGFLKADGSWGSRCLDDGSWQILGNTAWHAGNDGSGSGLDADTLDGQQGSYYRNASNLNAGTFPDLFGSSVRYNIGLIDGHNGSSYDKLRVWNSSSYTIGMNDSMTYGWLNDYAMTFTMNNESDRGFVWRDTDDAKSDAAMTLTTSGNLMVKNAIGIAGKTGNYWKDGSWGFRHQTPHGYIEFGPANSSHAHIYTDRSNFYFNKTDIRANGNTMWHGANDGSGSGLDADTLDGLDLHTGRNHDANKVVRTNSSGYIDAGWINTTSGDTGTGTDITRFYASQDAYIRYIDKASMRSVMNTSARSGAYAGRENNTTDTNYWVGSMGWGADNFDTTVWDFGSCFFDVWSDPSGEPSGTSHWTGVQAMHYSNASSRYGMRITCGAGQTALAYIQGRWGTTTYGWHKLWNEGNDGSGSGLDADTVDGIQGSDIITDSSTQSKNIYMRNGAPTMYFRDTNNNAAMVHVNSSIFYILRGGNDATSWTQVNSAWPLEINLTNNDATFGRNLSAKGNVTAYSSDKRLKENLKHIESPLDKVQKLNGYTFDWISKIEEVGFVPDHKKNDIGLIAQEVHDVLPQAVAPAPFDIKWDKDKMRNISKSGKDYLTVQYERLVPLLIESIKELTNKVKVLENKLNVE